MSATPRECTAECALECSGVSPCLKVLREPSGNVLDCRGFTAAVLPVGKSFITLPRLQSILQPDILFLGVKLDVLLTLCVSI